SPVAPSKLVLSPVEAFRSKAETPASRRVAVPRREHLWLRMRTTPGPAFAGCAEAQRRLQGLIEQVLLVAVALLPLHAHRVGSDCSLLLNFSPSPDDPLSNYYGASPSNAGLAHRAGPMCGLCSSAPSSACGFLPPLAATQLPSARGSHHQETTENL